MPLKKIPKKISKDDIRYRIFDGEPLKLIDAAIVKAQRFVQKEKYNKYSKLLTYREFKYVVAQLDNPRDYEQVLTLDEIKNLSQELEND